MGRIHRYRTALSRHHRSGGHGIHSPFAFSFVLNVLRERLPYYDYDLIEQLRAKAIRQTKHHRHPAVMSFKDAKMLYRITNFFKPSCVLQVGIDYGVAVAATLLPSSRSSCHLFAPHLDRFPVTCDVLDGFMNRISRHTMLAEALHNCSQSFAALAQQPFVVVNGIDNDDDYNTLRTQIFQWIDDSNNAVIIIRNIDKDRRMKLLWNDTRLHLAHGHTYTNEKLAVIVTRRDLPLQHFLLWF